MPQCPEGCPCDGGYKCQPFISLVCQHRNYEGEQLNYIISADGHFKEDRYYNIPEAADGTDPYLDFVGWTNFLDEIFIFGGRSDPRKVFDNSGILLIFFLIIRSPS